MWVVSVNGWRKAQDPTGRSALLKTETNNNGKNNNNNQWKHNRFSVLLMLLKILPNM